MKRRNKIILFAAIIAALIVCDLAAYRSLLESRNRRAAALSSLTNIVEDFAARCEDAVRTASVEYTGSIDWDRLLSENDEYAGWLYLKDSHIDYPVMKCGDNDKYLHHLPDGSYLFEGTLFVDYRCEDDFSGFNTVIYGHHMKNGTMFSDVGRYVREPDYIKTHRQLELITPNEKYHLVVFSSFKTDARGYIYEYGHEDEESKQAYIDRLVSENLIDTGDVKVSTDDSIIVLSTCVAATGYERYVLCCKKVAWTKEEKELADKAHELLDL